MKNSILLPIIATLVLSGGALWLSNCDKPVVTENIQNQPQLIKEQTAKTPVAVEKITIEVTKSISDIADATDSMDAEITKSMEIAKQTISGLANAINNSQGDFDKIADNMASVIKSMQVQMPAFKDNLKAIQQEMESIIQRNKSKFNMPKTTSNTGVLGADINKKFVNHE